MKTKIILLLLTITITQLTFGQECGTPSNTPNMDYGAQRQASQMPNDGPYCVAIKFHIVRQTNGTGGFNPTNIPTVINNLNDVYNPHNIYIVSEGYDFIDNNELYNFQYSYFQNPPSNTNIPDTPNAIDFFLVNQALSGTGSYAGYAEDILSKRLVIANSYVLQSTTPHELGHCLNLYHTHHGTFDEGGSDTGQCPELPNGSNGNSCGDYVSDTPADPRLYTYGTNQNVTTNCIYTGGNYYNPDTNNILSYSFKNCRTHFSNGQGQRMRDALLYDTILQNVISTSCSIAALVTDDEFTACNSNTNTTTISITNGNPPYNWTVSTNNISIIQNNGSNIVIKANTWNKEFGTVSCTYGNPPQTVSKQVWLNNPLELQSLSGPEVVSNNSVVNYTATPNEFQNTGKDGAQKYIWWLPYLFDIVMSGESPDYFNPNWWFFEQYGSQIQTTTGTAGNNGYVQVWGANKCGNSGAKIMWVEHGSGGSGTPRIVVYPNEADNELNLDLSNMPNGTLYVYLYNSSYNIVYYDEQTNDTLKTINTLGLDEGIYYLHVYDGVTIEIKQIIINH